MAGDLSPDHKRAVESLLVAVWRKTRYFGTNLQRPDFEGSLYWRCPRRGIPILFERIKATIKRVEGVPEREIDAAIHEAVDYVRHSRA
jgi:hypothetical protein